jgi:hypothetical protein
MSGKARIAGAALVGAAGVAVLLAVYFVVPRPHSDYWAALWVAAAILGPAVFELASRRRPEWGHGLAFAAGLGVVFGVWGGIEPPFEAGSAGQAAAGAAFLFAATFIVGMGGAGIASLIGRIKDRPE